MSTRRPIGRTAALPGRALAALGIVLAATCLATGCGRPVRFPAEPVTEGPVEGEAARGYDVSGDGRPDYFTALDADGRIHRIGYDKDADGRPEAWLDLDTVRAADCRHVVLVLDGVPFEMVAALRAEGRFRLFHEPTRVVATYPSMTDLALADVFETMRPVGYEARYYDHRRDRLAGGDAFYLTMKNEPWTRYLDYRAGPTLDALAYLFPQWAFRAELRDLRKLWDRRDRCDFTAYFVSTAGVGSREGREGLRKCLDLVERFAQELVWESRGLVQVTLLADHGHTLTRCRRVDFREWLEARGWRIVKALEGDRDVAPVEYGLVTYASFAVRRPAALAPDLLAHEGVRFVSYLEGPAVVVRSEEGLARIERRGGAYRYTAVRGDPLALGPIVETLADRADADGYIGDADWFAATWDHTYPDAPFRLWRAFHSQAVHVPDLVADLDAGFCAGSSGKSAWLPYMASTHGDLGRDSTVTFLMSTAGPSPAAVRSSGVARLLSELIGRPWPTPCKGSHK